MEDLKYPIGKYQPSKSYDSAEIQKLITDIEVFPELMKAEVVGLLEEQLEWKYRPEGWNIRQVIHHCADSHLNSISRFKLALTEEKPTIKPYFEHLWAELYDVQSPIKYSLNLIEALHAKWVYLLKKLNENDLAKTYIHPEHIKEFNLAQTIGLYSWHCRHHLAHIKQAKLRKF